MAAEAEAAVTAAREAADLAGVTVAVLADEAVVAALALAAAAAKAGRGSLRFRGSLGGRSGMSVPCGSGCGMRKDAVFESKFSFEISRLLQGDTSAR